jgi:3-methyladenine DNA glycosylase Tag
MACRRHHDYDPENLPEHLSIEDNNPTQLSEPSPVLSHVLVHKLAEVYDVADLKELSLHKLNTFNSGIVKVQSRDLVDATREAFSDMLERFDPLRAAVVSIFHKNRERLLEDENF